MGTRSARDLTYRIGLKSNRRLSTVLIKGSCGLHPLTLTKQGLPAALAELAERVPKDVQFSWPRSKRLKLDQSVALHVYRIAEEALGNAIKHSGATKITIELQMLSAQSCSYHR